MKSTNIENVVICRSNGKYGYTVHYKSGRSKTVETGLPIVMPVNVHNFIVNSPYSVANDCKYSDYHEVIYYNSDIRTHLPG